MSIVVTAGDVLKHFVRSAAAERRLAWWRGEKGRAEVVPAVMAHVGRVILSVPLEEVERVCRTTGHALGDVKKRNIAKIARIRDWTSAFGVSHVFHFMVERFGSVPTWDEFKDRARSPEFRAMLWEPAQQAVDACVESDGVSRQLAHDAMQWRIGNFYYSMLREQWVHAYLRRGGVQVLQHPLADTLFAADGWVGDRVISLFVSNAEYRSSTSGRKPSARRFLAGSLPPFAFTDMVLPPATRFGRVHLPSKAALDAYIDSLSTKR